MYYVTTLTLVYFIFTNIEVMLKIHNWQSSSTWVVTPPPIRESCSVTKNNPPIKNILTNKYPYCICSVDKKRGKNINSKN